ncbi:MAG: hypothetical protein ABI607_03800 [Betaproteobacteria bacterium]
MRPSLLGLILASGVAVVATNPAQAVICYVVYDRSENVIYQDTYPPLDMSSAGTPARDALRARGEHLTFGDVYACPTVVFLTGVGGNTDVRMEDVVGGMPASATPIKEAMPMSSRAPARAAPAAAAPAPAAKAKSGAY